MAVAFPDVPPALGGLKLSQSQ